MSRPDVIAVRTEVVVAHLVDGLFEAAQVRRHRIGDQDRGPLERAADAVGAVAPHELCRRLAEHGYATRMAERDTFERAREPCPWLDERLAHAEGPDAIGDILVELAGREPLARPAPDDPDAVTWRVPGPGGHVRHLLALRALRDEGTDDPALKRAWVYGLLVASWPREDAPAR